jgi:hypothetical protein
MTIYTTQEQQIMIYTTQKQRIIIFLLRHQFRINLFCDFVGNLNIFRLIICVANLILDNALLYYPGES